MLLSLLSKYIPLLLLSAIFPESVLLSLLAKYIPKLLYYALISQFVQHQVILFGKSAQATLPIINKSKWENLLVNVPKNKKEQAKIIANLDNLSAETKKLESLYQKKIQDVEELKKSILKKAFEGEL